MFLKQVTNCLLFLTLICLPHTDAQSIRADEGATVHLPCPSQFNDSIQVSVKWTKNSATSKNICEWTGSGSSSNVCTPRFTFNKTSFTLSIENVQLNDSGNYSCKTTRIIPPPTLDDISNVTLHVAAHPRLSIKQLKSSNDTCFHLLCSLEGLNPELVNFTWSGKDQRSLHTSTFYDMKSEVHLCKPDWSDGDTITCHASYSNSQTQTSEQLTLQHGSDKAFGTKQLIIICSAAAGLILCIIIIVVLCKCRKRDESGSIVFSNKVYENFSFAMSRQNTQSIDKPQTEECIYEN